MQQTPSARTQHSLDADNDVGHTARPDQIEGSSGASLTGNTSEAAAVAPAPASASASAPTPAPATATHDSAAAAAASDAASTTTSSSITAPPTDVDNTGAAIATTASTSIAPSTITDDTDLERKSRAERPRMASRKPSASILVPSDHPQIEVDEQEFPPDDARAMSPRRNSADVEKLSREARETLQQQARRLQSSLQALAERIDEVKSDHDKLENENKFLQDYIGGLTRTMSSKTDITSTTGATSRGKRSTK